MAELAIRKKDGWKYKNNDFERPPRFNFFKIFHYAVEIPRHQLDIRPIHAIDLQTLHQ